MKAFIYQNEVYLQLIPSKALFRSSLIHEVINRGDKLAMKISDQTIYIIRGTSEVSHFEIKLPGVELLDTSDLAAGLKAQREKLVFKNKVEAFLKWLDDKPVAYWNWQRVKSAVHAETFEKEFSDVK